MDPFPPKGRLCAQLPYVHLEIGAMRQPAKVRPSCSMPFIKPPNMIPNVDEEQILKELKLKHIGGVKPEAPWIKRCQHGIKFTEEIQESEI